MKKALIFNHESPRRGESFVTRKITIGIAGVMAGKKKKIYLGNLDAKRDWGYAPEYIEAMWLMLQQERAGDHVAGSGNMNSVRDFLEEAFGYVQLDWRQHVEIDSNYFPPTEAEELRADFRKARDALNWTPKISFKELVWTMMDSDIEALGLKCPGRGIKAVRDKKLEWNAFQ